jgi:hypothetical protein
MHPQISSKPTDENLFETKKSQVRISVKVIWTRLQQSSHYPTPQIVDAFECFRFLKQPAAQPSQPSYEVTAQACKIIPLEYGMHCFLDSSLPCTLQDWKLVSVKMEFFQCWT